ncbi:MAG: hypothetical protein ACI9GH_000329 [Candidatus Paceibacteria bacterium]|jgi:hypothetical protein
MEKEIINTFKKETEPISTKFMEYRKTAFARFPLLFVLMSSFGVIATFYGLEKIIDSIPLLSNQPFIVLTLGVLILYFTGTIYKKLS